MQAQKKGGAATARGHVCTTKYLSITFAFHRFTGYVSSFGLNSRYHRQLSTQGCYLST